VDELRRTLTKLIGPHRRSGNIMLSKTIFFGFTTAALSHRQFDTHNADYLGQPQNPFFKYVTIYETFTLAIKYCQKTQLSVNSQLE
jgi:hypothetical protein